MNAHTCMSKVYVNLSRSTIYNKDPNFKRGADSNKKTSHKTKQFCLFINDYDHLLSTSQAKCVAQR